MDVPTAFSPGAEVWVNAPYLISAEMHSTLGNTPSWIDAKFAITSPTPFPWVRMRAIDKIDGVIIAIWRFDAVKKSFDGNQLVWEAIGRDALYGVQDNSLRPPTAFLQPGQISTDPSYTEWPTAPLANAADFEEAAFPAVTEKIGPNYTNKAALRGWAVKDMTRFAAGNANSPSRPIIAVYNRGKDIIPNGQVTPLGDTAEGELLTSNFSQAQGDSANTLIRDVTKSWPWTAEEGVGIGYDYRTVWPGKVDPFAASGQAMELFPRGSQVGGIPCIDFPIPCYPCPHPHIDGCADCMPPSTRTCISTVDVVVNWTRTFGGGGSWAFISDGEPLPPNAGGGIFEGGTIDNYICCPGVVDSCSREGSTGLSVTASPLTDCGYSDWCGNEHIADWEDYPEYTASVGTVQILTVPTYPDSNGFWFLEQSISLTEIPTPSEACDAVAPGTDPFTDYTSITAYAAWRRTDIPPWECAYKSSFITVVQNLTVNLYVGSLQDGDSWVNIGAGSAYVVCRGNSYLSYTVLVPSSLGYFESGGVSLSGAVQAFADGGDRQTLDDAICNAVAALVPYVPSSAPDNDLFVNAFNVISLPFSTTLDTTGATTEPGEILDLCAPTGNTVWYKFTPLTNMTIKADTFGSDFDTVLAAYTGTALDNLVEIACNDDDPDCGCLQSKVTFEGIAGTTYYFQAGSYDGGGGGNMIFNLYDPPAPPPCIPPIIVEVTADNMAIYSRARAFGMGTNNANATTTALVPHMEDTWNPAAGQYFVKREIIANDYGVNAGHELDNLARSYLLTKSSAQHGYITLLVTLAGFLKAITGPFLTKPLQAGDSVDIGPGLGMTFNIETGPYIVDNLVYTWPDDISALTVSQRPASLTDGTGGGNVRNIGMASAGEGAIFESDWIDPLNTFDIGSGTGYPCVTIVHNLGVIPTKVMIVAAKHRIQNWYNTEEVDAAEPLFVTPAFFYTLRDTWVGYRVLSSDENQMVLAIAKWIASVAPLAGFSDMGLLATSDYFFKVFLNV